MAPGHYASYWGVADHADVSLILATRAAVRAAGQKPAVSKPAKKKPKTAESQAPSAALPEGQQLPAHRLVLAAHSAYFRTLLATDVPSSRTAALKDASGNKLLVVELEDEEEVQAGEAVLQLMYVEEMPAARHSNPAQLAVMCSVADRWQASSCLRLAFGALAALGADALSAEVLADVLPRLPFGTSSLGDLAAELNAFTATVTTVLEDVHAVLTTPALLRLLLALPFEVMLAWAGSDGLVVDSENSVVVALDCWVREGHGRACSKEELLQLSGRVRVLHLTPTYHLRLLDLPWWHHDAKATQLFSLSASLSLVPSSGWLGMTKFPDGWWAAPRKQLPAATLQQRTTLALDVPRAALEAALTKPKGPRSCSWYTKTFKSAPVYVAGHALQLDANAGELESNKGLHVSAAVHHVGFALGDGLAVLPVAVEPMAWSSCAMSVLTGPTGASRVMGTWGRGLATLCCCSCFVLGKCSAAELGQHLVGGHLRLRATVQPMLNGQR